MDKYAAEAIKKAYAEGTLDLDELAKFYDIESEEIQKLLSD